MTSRENQAGRGEAASELAAPEREMSPFEGSTMSEEDAERTRSLEGQAMGPETHIDWVSTAATPEKTPAYRYETAGKVYPSHPLFAGAEVYLRHGAQPKGQNHEPEIRSTHAQTTEQAVQVEDIPNLLDIVTEKEDKTPVLGYRKVNKVTQWRPKTEENSILKEVRDVMKELLLEKKESVKEKWESDVTYEGSEYEDPRLFLDRIRRICERNDVPRSDWAKVAAGRLRCEAYRWYDPYRIFEWTFEEFAENLLNRFDHVQVRVNLQTELLCKPQGKEDAAVFIAQKRALARRIGLQVDPELEIAQVQRLLRPEIQSNLVSAHIRSLKELQQCATRVEIKLRYLPIGGPIAGPSTGPPAIRDERRPRRPPYPCRNCGGDHYGADCPRRGDVRRNVPSRGNPEPRPQGNVAEGNMLALTDANPPTTSGN